MGVVYDAKLRRVLVHSHAGSDIDGDVTPALPVAACSNVRCLTQGTTVRIKWNDPDDLQVEGVTLAEWARTVLVRKAGAYPANAEDGTVVVSSTTRNAYASTAYVDTLPDTESTYYYRLCPETTKGVYNLEDANRFVASGLTWATVADVVRSGEAADVFSVGDTLTVEFPAAQESKLNGLTAARNLKIAKDAIEAVRPGTELSFRLAQLQNANEEKLKELFGSSLTIN